MRATKPRDLNEEEKKRDYAYLYYKEQPGISQRAKDVIAAGKPMNVENAMTAENIRKKIFDIKEEEETGFCYMPDGGIYVCGRHDMPGITLDMYRHWLYWWNENPDEADTRYKIWCPSSHHNGGFMWSTENIGDYLMDMTITQPLADHPESIGLDEEICKKAGILMVDGANARQKFIDEDLTQKPIPSVVMHFIYDAPDGIIMRSHFWIGYQAMGGRLINVLESKQKEHLLDKDFILGLVEHNSLEMNNLKELMPILYKDFRKED